MNRPTKEKIMAINTKKLDPKFMSRYLYWRGFYDLEFFSNYYFEHLKVDKKTQQRIKSAPFHKELIKVLSGDKDALVVCPRDHAKTTYCLFFIMRCIVYKQEKAILLVMSEGLGKETIGKIRDEFENNPRIQSTFGRLVPERTRREQNKKRTASQLEFLNGVSIESVKLRGTVRGKRPTLIIVDDPQENKDVENPQIARKFEHRFRSSVYGTLDPTGRCIVIGTVIGEVCLVNLLRQDNRDFAVVEYCAVYNPVYTKIDGIKHLTGGEPLWKSKRSIFELNRRLQKIKREAFQQEYMHIPANIFGEKIWKEEDLDMLRIPSHKFDNKFEGLKIYRPAEKRCIIGADTAGGKQSGDYSAIERRNTAGDLLASWYRKAGPEVMADVLDYMFSIGYVGIVAPECNNETGGTLLTICKERNYWRYSDYMYRREDIDQRTKKKSKKDGRNTNTGTRRTMLGELDVDIREGGIYEVTAEWMNEAKTFYRNETTGKREAMDTYHDDAIMCSAICWQMRKEPIFIPVHS